MSPMTYKSITDSRQSPGLNASNAGRGDFHRSTDCAPLSPGQTRLKRGEGAATGASGGGHEIPASETFSCFHALFSYLTLSRL